MSRSVSAPSLVTNTSPCWKGFIVPGSTLRYGSSFCIVTRRPRALRSAPRLEAVRPLPREEATPPVTKMCLVVEDAKDRVCMAKRGLPWSLSGVRTGHPVGILCEISRDTARFPRVPSLRFGAFFSTRPRATRVSAPAGERVRPRSVCRRSALSTSLTRSAQGRSMEAPADLRGASYPARTLARRAAAW